MNYEIIGICLIKNEDLYIKNIINNIYDFCDKIIILDNMSTDNTNEIINKLKNQEKLNKIRIHNVERALKTNEYIQKYVGRKAWIFGVDGDELYDKNRLKIFRKELKSGKYNDYWRICGSQLNVYDLNLNKKKAEGFLCPPSRWVGKLYNFITSTSQMRNSATVLDLAHARINFKSCSNPNLLCELSNTHKII